MDRHRATEHLIGIAIVIAAGALGLVVGAVAASARGAAPEETGIDGPVSLALWGTLDHLVGHLLVTMLVALAALVLVILGSDPRRPALVVFGYTLVAVYLFLMSLVAADLVHIDAQKRERGSDSATPPKRASSGGSRGRPCSGSPPSGRSQPSVRSLVGHL
jgi:hypothetical protein